MIAKKTGLLDGCENLVDHIKNSGDYVAHFYQHVDRNVDKIENEQLSQLFDRVFGEKDKETLTQQEVDDLHDKFEWFTRDNALDVLAETKQVLTTVIKKIHVTTFKIVRYKKPPL